MDLEKCLQLDQYPDQYSFTQTLSAITISFPALNQSSVEVNIDLSESSICAGIKGNPPSVCGIMFSRSYRHEESFADGVFKITFSKENNEIWPVLIIEQSLTHGIDPKSQFLLGFYKISTLSEESAFSYFKDSADRGFIPAQICVADILMSDTNPYDVPKDVDAAISILDSIPIDRRTSNIAINLSNALVEQKRPEEARHTLEISAEKFPDVKLSLVKMISPITNKNANDNDAISAVNYLESLVGQRNAEAMKLLSMHLAKGKGVAKNKQRAIELEREANSIDPRIPIELSDHSVASNLMISGLASAAVLGLFLLAYHRNLK